MRGLEYSDKEPENSTVAELTAQERADMAREATLLWGTKSSIKKVCSHMLIIANHLVSFELTFKSTMRMR